MGKKKNRDPKERDFCLAYACLYSYAHATGDSNRNAISALIIHGEPLMDRKESKLAWLEIGVILISLSFVNSFSFEQWLIDFTGILLFLFFSSIRQCPKSSGALRKNVLNL